jgi:hypothetical protein
MGYIYWKFLQVYRNTSIRYKNTTILLCGEESISTISLHAPCYDVASTKSSFIAHSGNSRIPTFLAKQIHIAFGA